MNKWTKGLLIFGVSASILGTCAMVTGIATGGVQRLLEISDKAVYNTTEEREVIRQSVDKLDISLHNHSLQIVESPDDQVHISYYKRLTGKTDFNSEVKNGRLTITDKGIAEERDMGEGLGVLLRASKSITGRYSMIQVELPKGKTLKDVQISNDFYGETVHMVGLQTEQLTLNTESYHTGIYNSKIQNGTIKTESTLYIGDSELGNLQIQSELGAILNTITIQGKVTLDSHSNTDVYLDKAEMNRISLELTSQNGDIYHLPYYKDHGAEYTYMEEKAVTSPYHYGNKDSKDQLLVNSHSDDIRLYEVE